MRIYAIFAIVSALSMSPAAAQIQSWDQARGWTSADAKPSSKATAKGDDTSEEISFERPELLVTIFEDAKLRIAPSHSAKYVRANDRTFPRATRPFIFVEQQGEWIEVLSFTTADVGRVAICPYSGLTDLRVRFFVRERDIGERLPVSDLPPMLDPVSEYRLDGCRNPNAKRKPTAPSNEDPGPVLDITATRKVIGPQLPPLTKLTWSDGSEAGIVRTRTPLPAFYQHRGNRICFERSIVSTGIGDPFRERLLRLCTDRTAIQY